MIHEATNNLLRIWDQDEDFSTHVDLSHCNTEELQEILRGKIDDAVLARATDAELLGVARKKDLERRLHGSEAVRYRAGVVVQYLARLEHTYSCNEALRGVTLERRNELAIVTKVPPASVVKLGSVVAAVDGQSTLLATFERTHNLLQEAKNEDKLITFRWAPFHQGWVEIDTGSESVICYLVIAYGVAAYFDRQQLPRKKLGTVSLTGATLVPISVVQGAGIVLSGGRAFSKRIVLRPPPDEWSPVIPIVDLAAFLVVAIAHANGGAEVRELEACRIERSPASFYETCTSAVCMALCPRSEESLMNKYGSDEENRSATSSSALVDDVDTHAENMRIELRQPTFATPRGANNDVAGVIDSQQATTSLERRLSSTDSNQTVETDFLSQVFDADCSPIAPIREEVEATPSWSEDRSDTPAKPPSSSNTVAIANPRFDELLEPHDEAKKPKETIIPKSCVDEDLTEPEATTFVMSSDTAIDCVVNDNKKDTRSEKTSERATTAHFAADENEIHERTEVSPARASTVLSTADSNKIEIDPRSSRRDQESTAQAPAQVAAANKKKHETMQKSTARAAARRFSSSSTMAYETFVGRRTKNRDDRNATNYSGGNQIIKKHDAAISRSVTKVLVRDSTAISANSASDDEIVIITGIEKSLKNANRGRGSVEKPPNSEKHYAIDEFKKATTRVAQTESYACSENVERRSSLYLGDEPSQQSRLPSFAPITTPPKPDGDSSTTPSLTSLLCCHDGENKPHRQHPVFLLCST